MMRQHESKFLVALIGAIALAGMSSSTALAGFLDQLEQLQKTKGVIHQYRFEGDNAASRQNDSGGLQIDLVGGAGEGGSGANDVNMTPDDTSDDVPWSYPAGDVNSIGYEAGYDGSQAMRPQQVAATSTFAAEVLSQRRSGAAYYIPTFQTPSMMTIETVIKPGEYNDVAGGSLHYVLQTRPGTGRGYFLATQQPDASRGSIGSLVGAIGNPFTSLANRPRLIGDYSEDWYYLAVTYDLSGTNAIVDSWYANLSQGGPLVQSQDGHVFAEAVSDLITAAPTAAGVGMFYRGPNLGQEFFNGAIDNLAIFNGKLSASDIAQSHRALTVQGVPEPATLALVALAGLALGLVRRR